MSVLRSVCAGGVLHCSAARHQHTATRHQHTHSSGPTPNYTKDTICCICKGIVTSIAFGYVDEIEEGAEQKTKPTERVVVWSAGSADRGLGRTPLYKNLEKQNVELWAGHSCGRWAHWPAGNNTEQSSLAL